MTPQECILDSVMRARGILGEYIEPGPHDCNRTIGRLFELFDDLQLTTALNVMNLEAIRAALAETEPERLTSSRER